MSACSVVPCKQHLNVQHNLDTLLLNTGPAKPRSPERHQHQRLPAPDNQLKCLQQCNKLDSRPSAPTTQRNLQRSNTHPAADYPRPTTPSAVDSHTATPFQGTIGCSEAVAVPSCGSAISRCGTGVLPDSHTCSELRKCSEHCKGWCDVCVMCPSVYAALG